MAFVANFISAIASILDQVLWVYTWLFIIRALLSWVNPDPWNPIVQLLARATDPVLRPIQRMIPMWRLGIDISPIIAIMGLQFLQRWFIPSLLEIAWNLR